MHQAGGDAETVKVHRILEDEAQKKRKLEEENEKIWVVNLSDKGEDCNLFLIKIIFWKPQWRTRYLSLSEVHEEENDEDGDDGKP